ncbi:MAG: hypothetical protein JJU29_10150 [Verrucomicrobia bacterium]|nr:hypothetical protein [Verrucomicrobiota bacterium]MCH8510598.1 hypothetical protein [Kiritimatiellia bacterium]
MISLPIKLRDETLFSPDPVYRYPRNPVRILRTDWRADLEFPLGEFHPETRVFPERDAEIVPDGDGFRFRASRPGDWMLFHPDQPPVFVFLDDPTAWPVSADAVRIPLKSDSPDNQAPILNEAMAKLSREGGGTLVVGPGVFRIGTLFMQSGVNLHLEAGAVLLASDNAEDFPVEPEENVNRNLPRSLIPGATRRLVLFQSVENAGIVGRGVISANGSAWRHRLMPGRRLMMNLMRLVNCKNIRIEGVELRDSEFWTVHAILSERLRFDRVKLISEIPPKGWDRFQKADSQSVWNNADGINPDSSQDVEILNCVFHTGDDCVPIKNTSTWRGELRDVRRIHVRGGLMRCSTTACKIGTETLGGFMEDIVFEDIDIVQASRAFAADMKDGATGRRLAFRNIRVHRCNRPFDFWIISREGQENQTRFSRLEEIEVANVDFAVTGIEGANGECHLQGRGPAHNITGVRFHGVSWEGHPFDPSLHPLMKINEFAEVILN